MRVMMWWFLIGLAFAAIVGALRDWYVDREQARYEAYRDDRDNWRWLWDFDDSNDDSVSRDGSQPIVRIVDNGRKPPTVTWRKEGRGGDAPTR